MLNSAFVDEVTSASFSPDGNYLVTSSRDRTIRIYKSAKLKEKVAEFVRMNLSSDHASHAAVSPDNNTLVLCLAYSQEIVGCKLNAPVRITSSHLPFNHISLSLSLSLSLFVSLSPASPPLPLQKGQFEPIWRFATNLTLNPIRSMQVASTGKFILTCSEGNLSTLHV